jgi:U5 snRNP spliceosome subunit
MGIVAVRPGETVTVVGVEADPNAPRPSHPIMLPGMPGWGVPPGAHPSHPIALPGDPWWGGGGPVDPGYSPPWAQVRPPVDPGYSPPWAQIPVEPPTEPPPVKPPADSGHWVWAWSPQLGRWVWVKVPGEGEAGPKTA